MPASEQAAIDVGQIRANGIRYVGRVPPDIDDRLNS
jgi:hypothetical protein